jgi:prepilin-type N-terminal cleavage/methylation domain-containing protein
MNRKGFTLIELMIVFSIAFILLAIALPSIGFIPVMPNYSQGSRVGVVNKLSERGIFFKSWEGEMMMALPTNSTSAIGTQQFSFNVEPKIVNRILEAMNSGKRIEVKYRQWLLKPISIESQYVVYDLKETK